MDSNWLWSKERDRSWMDLLILEDVKKYQFNVKKVNFNLKSQFLEINNCS